MKKPSFSGIFTRFSTATPPNRVGLKIGKHDEILRGILRITCIQSVKMRQTVVDLILFEAERNFFNTADLKGDGCGVSKASLYDFLWGS